MCQQRPEGFASRTSRDGTPSHEGATTLYRYWDKRGMLLYVGITGRGRRRQRQHREGSDWWWQVERASFEHFQTRRDAELAEATAIANDHPHYNVMRPKPHPKGVVVRQMGWSTEEREEWLSRLKAVNAG